MNFAEDMIDMYSIEDMIEDEWLYFILLSQKRDKLIDKMIYDESIDDMDFFDMLQECDNIEDEMYFCIRNIYDLEECL